ncbi:unnamed protein product [Allacma fusca]|uniref:Uncharacterized protein n=1 Tax=Allacma fusca TaxID=39272 RepID=A0A8J2KQ74_9HEXA|nr:unnamed protein product [Allacma fusca]
MPFQWKEKIFPKKKSTESNYPVSLFHIITGKSRKKRVNPSNNDNLGIWTPENDSHDCDTTPPTITSKTALDPGSNTNDVNNNPLEITTQSNTAESSPSKSATSDSSSLDICKEIEIMTYITHLDESNYNQSDFPGRFILPQQVSMTDPPESKKSSSTNTFIDPLKTRYFSKSKESLETNDSSEDSIKTYWGSASEKTSSDASIPIPQCQPNPVKTISEIHPKSKPEKFNQGKRDIALRHAVWENIEVILENFGLTFLDLVANTLLLVTVNSLNRKSKTLPKSDLVDIDPMEETPTLPKIIVMIDDPPKPTESPNSTMGRLISVEMYLLGLKLFIIPCYNFAPHVFKFMMKKLLEDSKQHSNSDSAYNFILQTGFTQLLKRPDTDVIIFDGDWLNGDVCQLIALAESSGHQLIFMKNHHGIRKQAFVKTVVAKIRSRLNEFDDLRLAAPSISTTVSAEEAPVPGGSAVAKTACLDETEPIIFHSDSGYQIPGSGSCDLSSGQLSENPDTLKSSCSAPLQSTEKSAQATASGVKADDASSTVMRRTTSLCF